MATPPRKGFPLVLPQTDNFTLFPLRWDVGGPFAYYNIHRAYHDLGPGGVGALSTPPAWLGDGIPLRLPPGLALLGTSDVDVLAQIQATLGDGMTRGNVLCVPVGNGVPPAAAGLPGVSGPDTDFTLTSHFEDSSFDPPHPVDSTVTFTWSTMQVGPGFTGEIVDAEVLLLYCTDTGVRSEPIFGFLADGTHTDPEPFFVAANYFVIIDHATGLPTGVQHDEKPISDWVSQASQAMVNSFSSGILARATSNMVFLKQPLPSSFPADYQPALDLSQSKATAVMTSVAGLTQNVDKDGGGAWKATVAGILIGWIGDFYSV